MSNVAVASEMPETKRRLLDAAMRLMWRQGFTATSVDEICEAAQVTKGSFFHYFKSKEEIGEAALGHYGTQQREKFTQCGYMEKEDPLDRLYGLLKLLGQPTPGQSQVCGCLMGNLAQEMSLTHPRIRAICEEMFNGFAGHMGTLLREAKARHCPKAPFDPESVAMLFVSLMQGSLLLAKARQDASLPAKNLEHFRAYLDILFAKPRRH